MNKKHRCSVAIDIEYYRYILENKGRYSVSQYFNVILEEYFELKGLSKVDYMANDEGKE